jgi:hypothetical protein
MNMFVKRAMLAALPLGLTACGGGVELMSESMFMGQANVNKAIDRGFDAKPLTELHAGNWIDPNGCHHLIIDDGVEGYMDARRYPDGRPGCDPTAVRNSVGGTFKAVGTSLLGDPI